MTTTFNTLCFLELNIAYIYSVDGGKNEGADHNTHKVCRFGSDKPPP